MTSTHPVIAYRRPPIVERVLNAYAAQPIAPEIFQIKSESWKGIVQESFPSFDPITEWDISVEAKNGVPIISGNGPRMRIRHLFWQTPKKPHVGLALQSTPERFSVNLVRNNDKIYGFEDVSAIYNKWLPIWAEHFGVSELSGVSLDYVNQLNALTVPQFVTQPSGNLEAGRILQFFQTISFPSIRIVMPYEYIVNFVIDERAPYSGRIMCTGNSEQGLRLEIQTRSTVTGRKAPISKALEEVDALHIHLLKLFDSIFTEEAKASFERIQ